MNAYIVTLSNNIWNFLFIWLAIQLGLNAQFVFLISTVILVASFVSFSVNVSGFSERGIFVSVVPNVLISTCIFVILVYLQSDSKFEILLCLPIIYAIEKRERLRISLASNKDQPTPAGFITASIIATMLAFLLLAVKLDDETNKVALSVIYALPGLLIRIKMKESHTLFVDRLRFLRSEMVPFASGFITLNAPLILLNDADFNNFRLILSYLAMTSPFLQLLITRHLMGSQSSDFGKIEAPFMFISSAASILIYISGFHIVAVVLSGLHSAFMHSRNKFSYGQLVYALLSIATPTIFLIGNGIIYALDAATIENMVLNLYVAILGHVVLSQFVLIRTARSRSQILTD